MAYMRFQGLQEYMEYLAKVKKNTPEIIGKIVYNMAEIVADEIRTNIDALPAVPDQEGLKAYKKKAKAPITVSEKKGLQEGFGITPMEQGDDFYYHVKLGFDGYNDLKTQKYPKGQPNVMIARSIESGSSVRDKHPFIRPAVNRARKKALEKAKEIIDEEISKID